MTSKSNFMQVYKTRWHDDDYDAHDAKMMPYAKQTWKEKGAAYLGCYNMCGIINNIKISVVTPLRLVHVLLMVMVS